MSYLRWTINNPFYLYMIEGGDLVIDDGRFPPRSYTREQIERLSNALLDYLADREEEGLIELS